MVKADLSRDYYGDLEVPLNADANEIKKQFKKLALKYHPDRILKYDPDRNPGIESEVTAKFQRIQSAHEVLLDATERAKYDANRSRNVYGGHGRAPATRGNPWSHVSAQYAAPPKPPPARPPPPSAGAQRYDKWETPRASGTPQQDAHARTQTFKAWETLRGPIRPKTSVKPELPKRSAGTSRTWTSPTGEARPTDDIKFKWTTSPKPRTAFQESKASSVKSPRNGVNTSSTFKEKYMPSALGDEPAASKRAYFTHRTHPPAPPPRPRAEPQHEESYIDPLKRFREQPDVVESRTSTPYTMHGGEKFDPHPSAHSSRTNNHRMATSLSDTERPIPRSGSDPNLASPHKHGRSDRAQGRHQPYKFPTVDDSTSSTEALDMKYQQTRRARATAKDNSSAAGQDADLRNHSATPEPKEAESMYAAFAHMSIPSTAKNPASPFHPTIPSKFTFSRESAQKAMSTDFMKHQYPHLFPSEVASPSGAPVHDTCFDRESIGKNTAFSLDPIEREVRKLLDQLLLNKNNSGRNSPQKHPHSPSVPESPSKKPRLSKKMTPCTCLGRTVFLVLDTDHICCANDHQTSFSMKVDSDTFSSTRPPHLTSRSTDSINTKFTPEDWHGQFTAGDYFKPEQNGMGRKRRTQSGSQARTRSPSRSRPVDPKKSPIHEEILLTPGGTKFSAAEWAETFKPQTFAPPAPPLQRAMKRPRGPLRATMGTAAVVDEDTSDDTKPLFTDKKKEAETPLESPDAMDVDTPNPPTPTTSAPTNSNLKIDTKATLKRPAAPTPTVTEEEIKVQLDDLHVSDILSSLDLPKPPRGPILPPAMASTAGTPLTATSPTEQIPHLFQTHTRPSSSTSISTARVLKESYKQAFVSYMGEWDGFSTRMIQHLVARKQLNDKLGPRRWEDGSLDSCRHGVKVDRLVLGHWNECMEKHAGVLRDWAVFLERERREAVAAAAAAHGAAEGNAVTAGLGINTGGAFNLGIGVGASLGMTGHAERKRPARKKTH